LLAVRLLSKIRSVLGVDISLQEIFTFPTVKDITEFICNGS
jgi:acyl carrier protein